MNGFTLLETQVTELKEQVTAERAEKSKILEMLLTEQEKTKLMLQPPRRHLFSFMRLFRKVTPQRKRQGVGKRRAFLDCDRQTLVLCDIAFIRALCHQSNAEQ